MAFRGPSKVVMARVFRDSAFNAAIGAAQRIQQRRQRKGRRQLVRRNLSNVQRRKNAMFSQPVTKNGVRNLVKTKTMSMATIVPSQLSQFQSSANRIESGTETFSKGVVVNEDNVFQISVELPFNPADPAFFPSLAAIANQYQKFQTLELAVTFQPSSATSIAGNIYMGFLPNADGVVPQDASGMSGLIGFQTGALYGKPTVMPIPRALYQTAYNVQTIEKPASLQDDTNMNSSGKLIVAVQGAVGISGGSVGNIFMSYKYKLMNKQLQQGSNSVDGTTTFTTSGVGNDTLVMNKFVNHQMLIPTDTAGVFEVRMAHCTHTMHFYSTLCTDGVYLSVERSNDMVTYTNVPYTQRVADTTANLQSTVFELPRCKYVRLKWLAAAVGAVNQLRMHSNCTLPRINSVERDP